jgi:hypothetical protein
LEPSSSESLRKLSRGAGWALGLFNNQTPDKETAQPSKWNIALPPKPPSGRDKLILDDISRLLKGEEPQHISLTRGNQPEPNLGITRLQDALRLGNLTRQEVGRDWQTLKEEGLRRKEELRAEIKKLGMIGTPKTKAKAAALKKELDEINQAIKAGEAGFSRVLTSTKNARIDARFFDQNFLPVREVLGKASEYDWDTNARSGGHGKKGGFGSVLFEGDTVVKRGDIGEREIDILKKVGEKGLGPELIFGEVGARKEVFAGINIHSGRVAMSKVSGTEIKDFSNPDIRVAGSSVGDIYWSSRANLHRMGIAHNDAHGGNLIVGSDGRAKFVDFGLAQDNARAALSEAFGAMVEKSMIPAGAVIKGGLQRDVQALKVPNSGISSPKSEQPESLRRMVANVPRAKALLKSFGLNSDEIAQVMASGIRNPESFYNQGAWGKLTNEKALQVIETLYNGI